MQFTATLVPPAAGPWKDHRKFLNPCFSLKILQSYMPIFNTEVKTLVGRLQQNIDGDAFNMYDYMDAATLDVVCRKCGHKFPISKATTFVDDAGDRGIIVNSRIHPHNQDSHFFALPPTPSRRDHFGHSHEHSEEREHELLERG